MTIYSHNGEPPAPIPFRIRLSDGRTRTDPASFTPEEIADAGYVPAATRPTAGENQVVEWGGADWVTRDKTVEELAADQADRAAGVNAERDRRLAAGSTVTVTGYGDIPLQGRAVDQTNLIALEVTAMQLVAAAINIPMQFRDAANVMHDLTPAQVLEMARLGKQAAAAFYASAWALKDGVSIPADYTDDAYWP